ncbi:sugar ABC transporter permease [Treponema sp. OMZ 840]|uniref:carbohydrate ABC transporter permease n=1 Tax=Treponema sp. OMZ 840 TaxID=244313 RepID=UPI003D8E63D1
MKQNKLQKVIPYILIAPAITMIVVFMLYPMVKNVFLSFFDYNLSSLERPFVGLKNYIEMFHEKRLWNAVGRTGIWTAVNLFFAIFIGVGSAFLMFSDFKGSALLKSFILIPWILPSVVTGYIWSLMLNEDAGIITWSLKALGIVSSNFSFFSTGPLSMAGAIMANIWRAFPFFTLMIYAKLCTIPNDQMDAAHLEGAQGLVLFRYVLFPFIQDILLACIFLCFIWTFNAYDIMKVMTNGGPAELTTTMSLLIQREAFFYFSLSNAATMSVYMFCIMLCVIGFANVLKKIFGDKK